MSAPTPAGRMLVVIICIAIALAFVGLAVLDLWLSSNSRYDRRS